MSQLKSVLVVSAIIVILMLSLGPQTSEQKRRWTYCAICGEKKRYCPRDASLCGNGNKSSNPLLCIGMGLTLSIMIGIFQPKLVWMKILSKVQIIVVALLSIKQENILEMLPIDIIWVILVVLPFEVEYNTKRNQKYNNVATPH